MNNEAVRDSNLNKKLAAILYPDERAVAERDFVKDMVGLAKGVGFSRSEWSAAIEALDGIQLPDGWSDDEFWEGDYMISSYMRSIAAHHETTDLLHHFVNDEGVIDRDAQHEFFVKVARLSKMESVAVIYMALNYWMQGSRFEPVLEEVIGDK